MAPDAEKPSWPATGALVALLALLAFAPSLRNGFVYDDLAVVADNPGLARLARPQAYFTKDYFRLSREATWRPLVTASYALDYRLWGRRPFGYHLSNVLWHCCASVFLLLACRSLGAAGGVCATAASLYAVHAIHCEAVCGVGFREDAMCAAFYLAAFALWPCGGKTGATGRAPAEGLLGVNGRNGRDGRAASRARVGASLVCFVLALLSKEMALSFPAMAFLKEWRAWRLARGALAGESEASGGAPFQWKTRAPRHALAWSIALAAFALFILFSGTEAAARAPAIPSVFRRLVAFPIAAVRYLWLFVFPYPLRLEHRVMVEGPAFWLSGAVALVLLIVLAALCLAWRRRFPYALESLAALLVLLVPVSGLAPLFHPMAERYLALPVAAYCWLTAGLAAMIARPAARRWAVGLLLATLVALAWVREADWHSPEALWSAEVQRNPDSALACVNLGSALDKQGKTALALRHYETAARLDPRFVKALNNVAGAYAALGNLDEAVQWSRKALNVDPASVDALSNLGSALAEQGHPGEAEQYLKRAVELDPEAREARVNLAAALEAQGKAAEARTQYQAALTLSQAAGDAALATRIQERLRTPRQPRI